MTRPLCYPVTDERGLWVNTVTDKATPLGDGYLVISHVLSTSEKLHWIKQLSKSVQADLREVEK
jgi:predicted alpha/beta hydrolase family esterase